MQAFYSHVTQINYIAELVVDSVVAVREALVDFLLVCLTEIGDRYDHQTRLIPYLLDLLTDVSPAVSGKAWSCLQLCGQVGIIFILPLLHIITSYHRQDHCTYHCTYHYLHITVHITTCISRYHPFNQPHLNHITRYPHAVCGHVVGTIINKSTTTVYCKYIQM